HMEEGRRPLGIAAARAAEQNQVAIGFDLSPLIRLRGSYRTRWLDIQRRNIELVRKFDLSMIITANARSHLDLRSPRDLMALAEVTGFEPSEARDALKLPGKLLALNKRSWLGPGVELL
ncbi:MAG: RNase P subunit p30 family protein, partial [Methanotrichaceae archaeon]|nr:RNase P subunit p30 family protein [Methanotrichaceae archaeon]